MHFRKTMLSYEKINFSAFCIREEKFEKNEKKIKNTMKIQKIKWEKCQKFFKGKKTKFWHLSQEDCSIFGSKNPILPISTLETWIPRPSHKLFGHFSLQVSATKSQIKYISAHFDCAFVKRGNGEKNLINLYVKIGCFLTTFYKFQAKICF